MVLYLNLRHACTCLLALTLVLVAEHAPATVSYHYTGNPFNLIDDDTPPDDSYTTEMSVELSFTLAAAVPANAIDLDVSSSLLNFSISDGRQLITTGNPVMLLSTDLVGNIVGWDISIKLPCPLDPGTDASEIETVSRVAGSSTDFGLLRDCVGANIDTGLTLEFPGSWSYTGDLVTYQYTGDPYDNFDDSPEPSGSYTGGMRVEVILRYLQPLPPDVGVLDIQDVPPISFMISDGRKVVTDGTPTVQLRTDGAGSITDWHVILDETSNPVPPEAGEQRSWIQASFSSADFGTLEEGCCPQGRDSAWVTTEGSWFTPTAVSGIGRSGSQLSAAFPNPFGPSTVIRFALGHPGSAWRDIYDVKGRRVRTLGFAQLPEGRHSLAWDGRDEQGRETSSGVYFVRLRGATGSAVMKVVRVR